MESSFASLMSLFITDVKAGIMVTYWWEPGADVEDGLSHSCPRPGVDPVLRISLCYCQTSFQAPSLQYSHIAAKTSGTQIQLGRVICCGAPLLSPNYRESVPARVCQFGVRGCVRLRHTQKPAFRSTSLVPGDCLNVPQTHTSPQSASTRTLTESLNFGSSARTSWDDRREP